jgi:putative DNA primase/helicase
MTTANIKAIPQVLRDRAQWVNYRLVERADDPKPTKVPINPKTGRNASSTDPETWSSFTVAVKRLESGGVDGIGYVFQDDHIGVDLDNGILASGELKPWAAEIVKEIPTYMERSPSLTGVHLISEGKLPEGSKGLKRHYQDGAVEIYSRSRFFTMTGDSLNGSSLCDCSSAVFGLYRRIAGPRKTNGTQPVGSVHMYTDSDRLEVALRDPVFFRLWHGDTSGNGGDDSAADLALCNKIVFYFGADYSTVDSWFRQSALMREKWERADYRQWTIDKAIEGTPERYSPPKRGHGKGPATAPSEAVSDPGEEESGDDDRPKPSATLKNAVRVILEHGLADIRFDDFLCRPMTGNPPREWADADDLELNIQLQNIRGFGKIGLDIVRNAALAIAFRNRTNCVKSWLESLSWDKTARIDHFFEDHFGAARTAYTRAASKNFWISMPARIFCPGCQCDHMVVLEGDQGIGKSAGLRIIGGDWFAEQHESATGKGFFEVLQGKLVVEISEMDSFDRVEVTKVKQIISCVSDRFRESYGRRAQDHPRQCIFVGTTNRDDWNRDPTGARRFWPIPCHGEIDLGAIRANRDQCFAEAVHRFKAGEPWWLMPVEETRSEQQKRYEADPWIDSIETFIQAKAEVTVWEILVDCLKFEASKIGKREQMRVATSLRFLGWEWTNKREGTKVSKVWRPK